MGPRLGHGFDGHRDRGAATAAPESEHDEAARLLAQCHGDPGALAQVIKTATQALVAQVVQLAQRQLGNGFVRDALSHAAPGGATGGTLTDGVGQDGPLARSGVHGEGLGGLVKTGRDDRQPTVTSVSKFSGADIMRYGDTFGGGRMAGDDAMVEGELQRLGGYRGAVAGGGGGYASDVDQATPSAPVDVCNTPSPGDPVVMPYPTSGGPSTSSGPDSKGPSTPGSNGPSTSGPKLVWGDDAGTTGGTTSATTRSPSGPRLSSVNDTGGGGGGMYHHVPGTRTPTDDADTGGGTPVVVNATQEAGARSALHRELAPHVNVADGGTDGRGATGSPAGGTSGVTLAARDKVDGQVEHEEGTLDLDKALAINQLVNPGRT